MTCTQSSDASEKEVTDDTDSSDNQLSLSDFCSDTTETHSSQNSGNESTQTHDSLSEEAKESIQQIESHLLDVVDDTEYLRSRDIAAGLNTINTKTVAALIYDVDDRSERVSIEEWSRTNWKVEVSDGT